MSVHLPPSRLRPGVERTPDEEAHLQSCALCRIDERALAAFFDDVSARDLPGIDEATDALTSVRYSCGEALLSSMNTLVSSPTVELGDLGRARWVETGQLGPILEVGTAGDRRAVTAIQDPEPAMLERLHQLIASVADIDTPTLALPRKLIAGEPGWMLISDPAPRLDLGGVGLLGGLTVDPEAIAVQVGAGLLQLHAAGVVHGGLEPGAIRIAGRDRCLLVNVGLQHPPIDDWTAYGTLLSELEGLSTQLRDLAEALGGKNRPSPFDVALVLLECSARASVHGFPYVDLGRIRQGGMGEVRRVADPDLHRAVAMKAIRPDLADSTPLVERFIHEALVTAQLQHPGVVPVHDLGVLPDGRPFFTMKEVQGRTLAELIAEVHAEGANWHSASGPGCSARRLVQAYQRVCETVAYAHSRGVVHRDLKPSNIMVGSFGEVVVLDWGLARVSASEGLTLPTPDATRVGAVHGTPAYMPPEQARGDAQPVGRRADVYALGATLYELLSGRPPYAAPTGDAALEAVRLGPPTPVRELDMTMPDELADVCETAMARHPEHRFPDADAVAQAVVDWLEGSARRDRARVELTAAQALQERMEGLRTQAAMARDRADAILAQSAQSDPPDRRAPAWEARDRADALEQEARSADLQVLRHLHAALIEAPNMPEAHVAMAERTLAQHRVAEASDEASDAPRLETVLRLHADALPQAHPRKAGYNAYIDGQGGLTVLTDPTGAEVLLHRYVSRAQRLVPVFERSLGRTPLRGVPLAMGRYLLRLRASGRAEVAYPVHIYRQHHWDGVPPGETETLPIALPTESELGEDCYVPAGWFWAGGPGNAAFARRRLWADAAIFKRFPVTNREYMHFLDDLVARGDEDLALSHAPAYRSGVHDNQGAQVYHRDHDGRFRVGCDPDGTEWDPDWPVLLVNWSNCLAYTAWAAERMGNPWRLPTGLEWEKAARGVDGRPYPWGDQYDPSFCCVRETGGELSLPSVVDSFPVDCSPYGVRGMSGNSTDYCLDKFLPTPLLDRQRVVVPPPDLAAVHVTGRGGNYYAHPARAAVTYRARFMQQLRDTVLGFRLARSWPEWDRSSAQPHSP